MNYAAEKDFGLTMTCCRDQLPSGVPSKYLCKEKNVEQHKRHSIEMEQLHSQTVSSKKAV